MLDNRRHSGILLHPTSLPSPYGIGDLGNAAMEFIDFLESAGQHLWQVLPLTHTGFGDSPYQSFSAYAGQPLLINPEELLRAGLLTEDELATCPSGDPEHVDYGPIIVWKTALLRKAYNRFSENQQGPPELHTQFADFCRAQAFWLDDYALFMACKNLHEGRSWLEWEEEYRVPTPETKERLRHQLKDTSGFYSFLQFLFFQQWTRVKEYANKKDIHIIGDIPIFVSMDSADVWANQHLFQLDSKGYPLNVAGVPPDYFSATGQLWGNPLYDWDVHIEQNFAWWISRIRHQLTLYDVLRIDHFRGFESYWSVPYGEETAINGEWIPSPGKELFQAVQDALGDQLPIIAEDLGIITPEVDALREAFHFPGMKVLQFAFENTEEGSYLPHNYHSTSCVCYTGTHDNNTTMGWFASLPEHCQEKVMKYTGCKDSQQISQALIRICLGSIAQFAIFPLQDVLSYGEEARMNTPGVAAGNWDWRYQTGVLTEELAARLKEMSHLFGRF